MDWAVTARTTVPHVREVDADRELTTWLLVDASPSMDFGTAELEKRELAVAAVAAVGFLTAGTGNRLGAQVLSSDGLRRFPARSGRTHLLRLLRTLLHAPRADAEPPTTPPVGPDLAAALAAVHGPPCGAGSSWWSPTSSTGSPTTTLPGPLGTGRCAGSPPGTRCSRSR